MKIIHPPVVRDFDIPVQQDDQPDAWHPVRIDITPNNPHTTKGRKASKR